MKKALKIIGIILLIIIILLAILVGLGYAFIKGKINKINYVEINKENLSISDNAKNDLSNYRNILIFGVDKRDPHIEAAYESENNRTDCIMIASINKTTKEVKITSIYRDLFVDIDGHDYANVNHAYEFGGPELSIATINKNFDLNITEFVSANFYAVATLVDAVGGIELDITKEELRYINGYIADIKKSTGMSANKITKTGRQKINGVQAVAYSRIRFDGGEIKRTERMRTVVTKAFEKLKTKNPVELNSIADKVLPLISTNIKSDEIFEMIPEIAKYNVVPVSTFPSKVWSEQVNGTWHTWPCSLETGVQELHKMLFNQDNYVVSDKVKEISEHIKEVSGHDENSF